MKLPARLYGTYGDVKREGRRMVTQLRRGAPWADLAGEIIDTRDVPGMIVIDGPSRALHGNHFHMYVAARAIEDAVPERLPWEVYETVFEPAIATLWGYVALLASVYLFFHPPGHQERFIRAAVRYWDELDAEGKRYSSGTSSPRRLWDTPNMIAYCIGNAGGISKERLCEPLPPGGLRELVNQSRVPVD